MDDLLEFLGYFFGFWLFLFNPKFRAEFIRKWRESGIIGRLFVVFDAAVSLLCGLFLPLYLLWWLLQ